MEIGFHRIQSPKRRGRKKVEELLNQGIKHVLSRCKGNTMLVKL